jgi:hypothetical protein
MTGMAEGEPMTELRAAAAAFHRVQTQHEKARERLAAAIRQASAAGVRQVDIIKISGYTREHVRRLLRPDPSGE